MRVCDVHPDRKAVDTISVKNDEVHMDVCDECKYAVLELLSIQENTEPEQIVEQPKTLLQKVFSKN